MPTETLSELLESGQHAVTGNITITAACWAAARAFYEVPDEDSDDEFRGWALANLPSAAARSTLGALRLICICVYDGKETLVSVARSMTTIFMLRNGAMDDVLNSKE